MPIFVAAFIFFISFLTDHLNFEKNTLLTVMLECPN